MPKHTTAPTRMTPEEKAEAKKAQAEQNGEKEEREKIPVCETEAELRVTAVPEKCRAYRVHNAAGKAVYTYARSGQQAAARCAKVLGLVAKALNKVPTVNDLMGEITALPPDAIAELVKRLNAGGQVPPGQLTAKKS